MTDPIFAKTFSVPTLKENPLKGIRLPFPNSEKLLIIELNEAELIALFESLKRERSISRTKKVLLSIVRPLNGRLSISQ